MATPEHRLPAPGSSAFNPPYPLNCDLIKNIAMRMLLTPTDVSGKEIQALASSVVSHIRQCEKAGGRAVQ